MRIQGLVLEVQRNKVTVLTPDGQFRKLPKKGRVEVGDEYAYSVSNRPYLAVAASFALFVMSSLLASYWSKPAPSAFGPESNPSSETRITSQGTSETAAPQIDKTVVNGTETTPQTKPVKPQTTPQVKPPADPKPPVKNTDTPPAVVPPAEEPVTEPEEPPAQDTQPEEPPIMVAEPDPILEEATRRNLVDWFLDLFYNDIKQ